MVVVIPISKYKAYLYNRQNTINYFIEECAKSRKERNVIFLYRKSDSLNPVSKDYIVSVLRYCFMGKIFSGEYHLHTIWQPNENNTK